MQSLVRHTPFHVVQIILSHNASSLLFTLDRERHLKHMRLHGHLRKKSRPPCPCSCCERKRRTYHDPQRLQDNRLNCAERSRRCYERRMSRCGKIYVFLPKCTLISLWNGIRLYFNRLWHRSLICVIHTHVNIKLLFSDVAKSYNDSFRTVMSRIVT